MAYEGGTGSWQPGPPYEPSHSPSASGHNINQANPDNSHLSFPPPYPSHYGPDRINMPYPQMPPPQMPPVSSQSPLMQMQPPELQPQQEQPWHSQPQRINEAVNSAFAGSDGSYISPEVLSQITANVIQQLQVTGLQQQQPPQQQQPQWPQSGYPGSSGSPIDSRRTGSPSKFSTPPESVEFQRPLSNRYSSSSPRSSSRPVPLPERSVPERYESPPHSQYGQKMERPSPPSREATITEMTTLEKIWGKLFEDGKPTDRLGQFLRGIAVHLIENYPPGNTIVIVPEKLQKFYEDTKVPSDPYPWQDIFDDRTSSISRLFREVEAEHHLVQIKLNERPDIPGLTPLGFQHWATLMIQAHPEKEFIRLQNAVLNMPISNPDDKRERFPKELPRRLFPEVANLAVREQLDGYIKKHCTVNLPPITEEEIAAAARAHSTSPPSSESNGRDRTHPQSTPLSATVEDAEDSDKETPSRPNPNPSPNPIERERKPYSAAPGGGKVYEDGNTRSHASSFSTSSSAPRPESVRPDSYPEPPYSRTGSTGPHRSHGRSRSSSRGFADYRHSDGDLLTTNPSSSTRHARTPTTDYFTTSTPFLPDEERERERERRYQEDHEEKRLYETLREREREREKSKYHDHLPHRGSWGNTATDEDYYRGMLGGGTSGGPVGGHDYRYR